MTDETKTDDRKWCFMWSRDDESAFGPFESRDAVIDEAREIRDDRDRVFISRCIYLDPVDYLPHHLGRDIIEQLEERASDDGEGDPDGNTFELVEGAATDELEKLVGDWCARNVKSNWFLVDPECIEEVTL